MYSGSRTFCIDFVLGHQVWPCNMKLHTVMKHPDTFSSYFRILFGLQHTGSGLLQTASSRLWLAVLGENNKDRNDCRHPSRDVLLTVITVTALYTCKTLCKQWCIRLCVLSNAGIIWHTATIIWIFAVRLLLLFVCNSLHAHCNGRISRGRIYSLFAAEGIDQYSNISSAAFLGFTLIW